MRPSNPRKPEPCLIDSNSFTLRNTVVSCLCYNDGSRQTRLVNLPLKPIISKELRNGFVFEDGQYYGDMTLVTLTKEEREELEAISSKGNARAQSMMHALILLACDEGS